MSAVKIEETLKKIFPTLKEHESGVIEILISSYSVRLLQEENGSCTILLKDDIDMRLPNEFDSSNREEAIEYFISVANAVIQKVEYDNEPKDFEVESESEQRLKLKCSIYKELKETYISNDKVIINWNNE